MAVKVFTSFTKRLAEYIGNSQTILYSVANGLYSKHLIDGNAKRTATNKGLIEGSTLLLDNVETKLKQDEALMEILIDVLKDNEALSEIAKEMEEAYESLKSQRKRKPDGNGLASKPKQAKLDDDNGISDFDEELVDIKCTSIPRRAEIIVSSETTKGFGEDHKALAVIITNTYEGTTAPLIGIKKDRDELLQTFDRPHFHCIRVDNALEEDIVDAVNMAAEKARSCSYPCLVIAFSGHGGKHNGDSVIITEDIHRVPVKSFVDFVNGTFSGIDIPKAFLIDACRGRVALPKRKSITEQVDSYLIATATKFGHIAVMRESEEEGSYWMPVVARFIREKDMPIIDVIRAANEEVENDRSLRYRQTPQLVDECFSSTLNIYAGQGKTEVPKPNSGVEDTDNGEERIELPHDQLKNLTSLIKDTHVSFYDIIGSCVERSASSFAAKLFAKGIIGRAVRKSKMYSEMYDAFDDWLTLKKTVKEVESHCEIFLECLSELGGTAKGAAQNLRTAWHEAVQKEFKIPFLELKASKV